MPKSMYPMESTFLASPTVPYRQLDADETFINGSFGYKRTAIRPVPDPRPLNMMMRDYNKKQAMVDEYYRLSALRSTEEFCQSEIFKKHPKLGD